MLFTQIIDVIDKTDWRVGIASTSLQIVDLPEIKARLADRQIKPATMDQK